MRPEKMGEKDLPWLVNVLDQWPTSIVITNQKGKIEYVNPVFTEITGYSYEEAVGKTPRILKSGFHPREFYKSLWDTILAGKKWTGEFRNKKKNGGLYWEFQTISPVKNWKGEITHFVSVRVDDTERKRIEGLKDEIIGIAAHELKNPLAALREGVSQVVEGIFGEPNGKQKSLLELSLRCADRLLALTSNLLDLSKLEAKRVELKAEPVDLTSLVREIKDQFLLTAQKKGLEIRLNLPKSRCECVADKEKISQAVANLLNNALKFTQKGSIQISVSEKPDEVECSVSDTGRGIAKEDLSRTFQKFQQFGTVPEGCEKGAGLGLAIVKSIVELHRGKIWAESEPNKGSTFVFSLPKK